METTGDKKFLQEKTEISETPYNSLAYEKLKFWVIKEIQLWERIRQATEKRNIDNEKHKVVTAILHNRYATIHNLKSN
jgi:hypothetical protein